MTITAVNPPYSASISAYLRVRRAQHTVPPTAQPATVGVCKNELNTCPDIVKKLEITEEEVRISYIVNDVFNVSFLRDEKSKNMETFFENVSRFLKRTLVPKSTSINQ